MGDKSLLNRAAEPCPGQLGFFSVLPADCTATRGEVPAFASIGNDVFWRGKVARVPVLHHDRWSVVRRARFRASSARNDRAIKNEIEPERAVALSADSARGGARDLTRSVGLASRRFHHRSGSRIGPRGSSSLWRRSPTQGHSIGSIPGTSCSHWTAAKSGWHFPKAPTR